MSASTLNQGQPHHVVIIGGGFAGLFAAAALGRRRPDHPDVRVTLIDKRNFHTFQPLLYQVASGMLTTGDICIPHRVALRRYANVHCLMATAYDIDPEQRIVRHEFGTVHYDTLIVATGVKHQYFGNSAWAEHAPGLKTVEHALRMRRRIFHAFEQAEHAETEAERQRWLTFIIVGGGPTGVELAGAIGELAHRTMVGDFRNIDTRDARIVLAEGADHVLPVYDDKLGDKARRMLGDLGVDVITRAMVTDIDAQGVEIDRQGNSHRIDSRTVLWAAGVRASAFGEILAGRLDAATDRGGRIHVASDLSLPNHPDIFITGDLAACTDANGANVPGLAPAAIQQGEYVARLIRQRLQQQPTAAFVYKDKGSMAVIGRNRAVAQLPRLAFGGISAWWLWILVHIYSLIGGERRIRVMLQWAWKYITRRTGDRLITGRPTHTRQLLKQHQTDSQP